MKPQIRLTTLGIELALESRFPDGCPILKAWHGKYFPTFNQTVKENFQIVQHQDADAFLLPSNVSFYTPKRLNEIGKIVTDLKLPSIGFDISHEHRKPKWLDYIIRFSWYRQLQESGGIISSAYLNSDGFDILAETNIHNWQPTPKETMPSVSFCGREGGSLGLAVWKILPKSLTRWMAADFFCSTTRGIRMTCCYPLRVDAMQILAKDLRIKTDFVGRGSVGMQPGVQGNQRQEFVDNLLGNAYALCVRGADNYSWRFYEALSVGKIPVLIDTGCLLPMEDEINWDNLILRVPATRLLELPDRLLAWHSSFSPQAFSELQRDLRLIFERIKPVNFHLEMFRKILPLAQEDDRSLSLFTL